MSSRHEFHETPTSKGNTNQVEANGSPKYRNKFFQVCSFILVMEICERLAYYSTTSNLTIYLQKRLDFGPGKSSLITSLFSTLVYVTPILGAYVADTYIGRYRTIVYFSIIYIIGMYLVAVAAIPSFESTALFLIALFVFVCIGAGGIKSNVVTLGADQYDPVSESKQLASFFNWFYWTVNCGSLFASVYFADLAVNGNSMINEKDAFMVVYFVSAALFTVALIAFFLGKNRYVRVPPDGSALAKFAKITWYSAKQHRHGQLLLLGVGMFVVGEILNILLVFINGNARQILAYVNGVIILGAVALCIMYGRQVDWVHKAHASNGGYWTNDEVEGAWEMLRLTPYLAFQVSFWNVYMFMPGPWINQGCQMDCRVWPWQSGDAQYNPGSWAMWNNIAILAFVPIFDMVIYPCIGKIQGRAVPTHLQRIGAGYVFVILCMIVAAVVEIIRKDRPLLDLVSVCAKEGSDKFVSDLSLWWQLPQYFLLGIGEILASVTAYDLFYVEVPDNMKSVAQSVQLLTVALGGAVNSMLQNVFISMGELPDNLNDGHQEYMYFTAAFIGLAFLILFMAVSRSFVYKTEQKKESSMGGDERERVGSYHSRSSLY